MIETMIKKGKKNQRSFLVILIVICMGVILIGGIHYVASLRSNLTNQSIQNVRAVTMQQQQAFDNFISGDRERLHSYAEYFSQIHSDHWEELQKHLAFFGDVDAFYTVIDLETGYFCNNKTNELYQMTGEELSEYQALSGNGVRDPYTGLYTDDPMFGYYECFTYADGVRGLIQKSYDRRKVSETFSLSFYNNQGFAYVVNQKGDILLRSEDLFGGSGPDNIFDVLSNIHSREEDIDQLTKALEARQMGNIIITGDKGEFAYTYVPVKNVENWYLISIVPMEAITEETNHILLDSQVAFLFLIFILLVCIVTIVLIWRTYKDIQKKDQEIEYQEQLFDIFSTYLSNNTDDVYMMIDLEADQVDYISPNVERVLGISIKNITSITSKMECFDGSKFALKEGLSMEDLFDLEPGTSMENVETGWCNPQTGEQKWFRVNVYCIWMQNRSKIIIYISDRTQERQAQDTLAEALKLAQVANHAKSAFLSSVSHDIRTPMNAIIGLVALLKEEADNTELVLDYTRRIDAASQHLLGLINDVLDMNKIESGSATLNLTNLDLAEIIEEINSIIRPQARAKKQKFEIFASSFAYEHLIRDKLRINQILINLLSNAVKYTLEKGQIQMWVEELPQVVDNYSRIRFVIKDNGLGMSEEYQTVMFDPFTREETNVTRQIQGTGLGMAITKSLVDLMGGTIQVQSKLGEGSVFTIELELRIQEQKEDCKFWSDYGVSKMIVADDDEEVCLNVVKAMTVVGVQVDYSTSGAKAVEMMRTAREKGEPYDLILLDWKMPDLDGLGTARLIRTNYPDKIPILLLTAYDWEEIERDATEIGVDHFMPKPFFLSTFKDVIQRVMGNLKKAKQDKNSEVVKGKHILVVDDIEVNRMILVKILSTLGAFCDMAEDGQKAVEMFEKSKPGEYDLIFMDVQMPVMDGYMATRTIRSGSHPSAKTIPIIAMTANAFVDDVRDAIDSGMNAHIAKPVQLDKLKETIQQVFHSQKQ